MFDLLLDKTSLHNFIASISLMPPMAHVPAYSTNWCTTASSWIGRLAVVLEASGLKSFLDFCVSSYHRKFYSLCLTNHWFATKCRRLMSVDKINDSMQFGGKVDGQTDDVYNVVITDFCCWKVSKKHLLHTVTTFTCFFWLLEAELLSGYYTCLSRFALW